MISIEKAKLFGIKAAERHKFDEQGELLRRYVPRGSRPKAHKDEDAIKAEKASQKHFEDQEEARRAREQRHHKKHESVYIDRQFPPSVLEQINSNLEKLISIIEGKA